MRTWALLVASFALLGGVLWALGARPFPIALVLADVAVIGSVSYVVTRRARAFARRARRAVEARLAPR